MQVARRRQAEELLQEPVNRGRGEDVTAADDVRHLLQLHEYAALTIDLSLPDLPGLELLREVRSMPRLRDLPVIILSATARIAEANAGGEKFARTVWLNKPIDRRRLTEALNTFIAPRPSGPEDEKES